MQLQLPTTVSPLELAWTLPAIAFFWRCLERTVRAWCLRNGVKREGVNGELRLIASIRCARQASITFVFFMQALAGLYAMTLPVGPASDPENPGGWLLTVIFIVEEIGLGAGGEILERMEAGLARLVQARLEREAAARRKAAATRSE